MIEDDPNWNITLCKMYKELFKDQTCAVIPELSGKGALGRIENGEKFDLISLDIILRLTHPKDKNGRPDTSEEGADGRIVLRRAHDCNSCKSMIVISKIATDETFRFIVPKKEERTVEIMTLPAQLNILFPAKSLFFPKENKIGIQENIEIIKRSLAAADLLSWFKSENDFYREGQYWCITFGKKTIRLKDIKGLQYIHCLLGYLYYEASCVELYGALNLEIAEKPSVHKIRWAQIGKGKFEDLKSPIEYKILDERAVGESKKRLGAITIELEKVKQMEGKEELEEKLKNEKRAVQKYLAEGYGVGKKLRELREEQEGIKKELEDANEIGDLSPKDYLYKREEEIEEEIKELLNRLNLRGRSVKKIPIIRLEFMDSYRKKVSKAIQRAYKVIRKENEELYEHLQSFIHLGYYISYSPPSHVDWTLKSSV